MRNTFKLDTELSNEHLELIYARYDGLKDHPLHLTLVDQAGFLLAKQDNRALFELFDQGFKELGPLYPLVLIYSLHPAIIALYERLGIAEPIRRATLSDIAIWVKTYEDQNQGTIGLDRYGWICRHLCAKVLRLGRLQFEQGFFYFPHSIYYDTKQFRTRTFVQEGIVCSPEGYIDGGPDSCTTCAVVDGQLVAHEVDQQKGTISLDPTSVPLAELSMICSTKDPALFIHIPEGGPLTPSLVDVSFSLAQKMFSPTLFVCNSWLLDPELLHILPSEGNICHFMQRFKKFPVSYTTPQIYERVFGFGATQKEVLAWECTTSLQKRVQDHIREGGIFRTMGGYIPVPRDA